MQNNCCLKGISDQFLLARVFNRLTDHRAQFQKLGNLITCFMLPTARMRKFLQMD